jgi:lysine/ornithine N-monooxygenase
MNKHIKTILSQHIANIKNVDKKQAVPKLAKNIDSITQQTLRELYNLKEIYTSTFKSGKKGHCC